MTDFDYDKIRDMEYDPERERYIKEDGSEFKVTPYGDGSGYKYDYYDSNTYENSKHNSTHVKSDLNENWTRVDNDRDNNSQKKSSGKGCYLTTACMEHFQEKFDDNCYELMSLRWFRDNFVKKEDIIYYYNVAPILVNLINSSSYRNDIYKKIYDEVISKCVKAIEEKKYTLAYELYKRSILNLKDFFEDTEINMDNVKKLKL